jgi:hypothetical protein
MTTKEVPAAKAELPLSLELNAALPLIVTPLAIAWLAAPRRYP